MGFLDKIRKKVGGDDGKISFKEGFQAVKSASSATTRIVGSAVSGDIDNFKIIDMDRKKTQKDNIRGLLAVGAAAVGGTLAGPVIGKIFSKKQNDAPPINPTAKKVFGTSTESTPANNLNEIFDNVLNKPEVSKVKNLLTNIPSDSKPNYSQNKNFTYGFIGLGLLGTLIYYLNSKKRYNGRRK